MNQSHQRRLWLRAAGKIREQYQLCAAEFPKVKPAPTDQWERVTRFSRLMEKARQHQYPAAFRHCFQQWQQSLSVLMRELTAYQSEHTKTNRRSIIPSLQEIDAELSSLPDEFEETRIDWSEQEIVVRTPTVILEQINLGGLKFDSAGVNSTAPSLIGLFRWQRRARMTCIIHMCRGIRSARGKANFRSARLWPLVAWEISFCWYSRSCRPTTQGLPTSPWIAGGILPVLTAVIPCRVMKVAPAPTANINFAKTAAAAARPVMIRSVRVVLIPVKHVTTASAAVVFLPATPVARVAVRNACAINPVPPVLKN